MLALATMMMAACANNDLVDDLVKEEVPQTIGFEPFANKATRAIDALTDLQNAGFSVWGYKTATATTLDWSSQFTVFDKVAVTYSDSWGYENPKYWDETSTYKFYAVAPVEPADYDYDIDAATGLVTIKNAESALSSISKDYLIARGGNSEGNINGASPEVVDFNFNHTMAKISFILKASDAMDEIVKIKSLKMHGYDNGKGTFTQSSTYDSSAKGNDEWKIGTSDVITSSNAVTIIDSETDVTKSSNEMVGNSFIMVPQTIAKDKLTFTITYMIGTETFANQVGVVEAEQVWGTDTHTTYTIIVGPNKINFSGKVLNWTNTNTGSTTIK